MGMLSTSSISCIGIMEKGKVKTILWVAKGKGKFKPVVQSQFETLGNGSFHYLAFYFSGQGIFGYIMDAMRLKIFLYRYHVDLIHAHYSFTAFVVSLITRKRLVVSLMGSDVVTGGFRLRWVRFFCKRIWSQTIVKSEEMFRMLGVSNVKIIPNGVDFELFTPMDTQWAKQKLGWHAHHIHLLFPSDKSRLEKNFSLLNAALEELENDHLMVHELKQVKRKDVPIYFAAADIVIMTSKREGSPNAIKEALAMNKLVVTTKVGDVEYLMRDVHPGWVCNHASSDVASAIKSALECLGVSSNGRIAISELSATRIAEQIEELYTQILSTEGRKEKILIFV